MTIKRILVGEGSAEPTVGFSTVLQKFSPDPVEFFFGVRRSPEGLKELNRGDISVVANFPGRGMKELNHPPRPCQLSAYGITRMLDRQKLRPDALLCVATPPDHQGIRSLGTANGPLQCAIDHAPLIIVEEWADLPVIPGAATIPADKPVEIISHMPAAFAPLSRPASKEDYACAAHIASLIPDNIPLQIGVGGIIEALADCLKPRRGLRVITGAVGSTVKTLHEQGCLAPDADILGTAMVGDDDIMQWAVNTPNLRLMSSREIHNPQWLASMPGFHSINIALSVDLQGNVNAESVGSKLVSGKGGSPNFAEGASLSEGGHAIVALRADRDNSLVKKIPRPTIPGHQVSYLVTENGVADLRGKSATERAEVIQNLFRYN
jgi:acyl-CoA hydrolase